MASATRRLSQSMGEVRRRVHLDENAVQKHPWGGSVGRWLEAELDYQKNMLPGIDNMWLLLDEGSDFNPVCASISTFEEDVDVDKLIEHWEDMARRFPSYRRRPSGLHRRFHTAVLRDYEGYDIRDHFSVETMPDGANGKRELEDHMAEFIARGWDLSKALWEVKVLRNYHDGTGAKSAMMSRAHHTLADGQGFVISQLTTTSARKMVEKKQEQMNGHAHQVNAQAHAVKTGRAKLSDIPFPAASSAIKPLDPYVPSLVVACLFYALHAVFVLIALIYGTLAGLRAGIAFLTFRRRALRYEGARPYEKEFSFSDAVGLADIKLVQKAFGSKKRKITLNDVMCAVVAKTLWRYFERVGQTSDSRVALFIPISIRTPDDPGMGNFTSGMIAYFRHHRGRASTQVLIDAAHDEMRKLKTSFWPRVCFKLLAWAYRAPVLFPAPSRLKLVDAALESVHGVLTNVPGPPGAIDVEGARILRWTASPPQAGKGTLGIGMISYDGHLVWTVTADKTARYEGIARELTEGFVTAFEEFLEEAKQRIKD
ncbi:hypothetical protein PUNSTDRAFT_120513 [Punctularia strigosozonata HHB-11173 SS5]|uniref:uncharacterized protein n=1 Tax=Punctularia strigosozonata (strain HHB-11173) TaxID=741275 RepID=UPI00044162C0|nr:uncharacterized protein PUNSTDRAFT_120513 [Punctularia strigosozonata HHB-11173 SS5]EIN09069.1 hypothetical protein PUNSTDRAFT_120513 [Punctularia strigosozonata HHB-11173 SS5]